MSFKTVRCSLRHFRERVDYICCADGTSIREKKFIHSMHTFFTWCQECTLWQRIPIMTITLFASETFCVNEPVSYMPDKCLPSLKDTNLFDSHDRHDSSILNCIGHHMLSPQAFDFLHFALIQHRITTKQWRFWFFCTMASTENIGMHVSGEQRTVQAAIV